ncbi:MAG: ATP-grasp domain-containing protein [Prevotella sp.]|nr:ATP-grasp domain-containing protein [Prevotella sp.]
MKKLLVLGGSPNQLRLVEAAKNAGIYTVVCNHKEECAARMACHQFYQQDYRNEEKVLAIAQKEHVDGVISNSEAAMPIVAYVAERLNLPGNSVDGIEQLTSKTRFRELQRKCGIYAPNNFECDSWEEFRQGIGALAFPVIVKPCESSGTRGTTRIDRREDIESLQKAFEECRHFSVNGKVSVEEYVTMNSLKVIDGDVFVSGKELLWNGFFTCYRSHYAPMLPMMESFPIHISNEDFLIVKDHIRRLFEKAGIIHGQYNVEMYFTDKGELFVIEINARQGGNNIPHLIELHSGIDFDKLLVTTAVGNMSYFDVVKNKESMQRYITQYVVFSREFGILERLDIDEGISRYLIERTDVRHVGEEVVIGMNAGDSIARLVFDFGDADTQQYYLEIVEQLITPVIRKS